MSFKKRVEKSHGPVELSPGTLGAWIIGIIDVGTQPYEFNGVPGDPRQRLWIVIDIPKQPGNENGPMLFSHDCVFSFHESSNLRDYYEGVFGVTLEDGTEVDPRDLLGKECTIQVKKTKGGWPTITAMLGATRGSKLPKTNRKPMAWSIDDLKVPQIPKELDWIPAAYGHTIDSTLIESEEYQDRFHPERKGAPTNADTPY